MTLALSHSRLYHLCNPLTTSNVVFRSTVTRRRNVFINPRIEIVATSNTNDIFFLLRLEDSKIRLYIFFFLNKKKNWYNSRIEEISRFISEYLFRITNRCFRFDSSTQLSSSTVYFSYFSTLTLRYDQNWPTNVYHCPWNATRRYAFHPRIIINKIQPVNHTANPTDYNMKSEV